MELELARKYFSEGTNGEIFLKGSLLTYCIELPWKDNHTRVSCIPEGRYELAKRWNQKFDRHLQVLNVPGREDILIHPANDAMHELQGCIAPVSILTAPGKGLQSRKALSNLVNVVYAAFAREEQVYIIIKS